MPRSHPSPPPITVFRPGVVGDWSEVVLQPAPATAYGSRVQSAVRRDEKSGAIARRLLFGATGDGASLPIGRLGTGETRSLVVRSRSEHGAQVSVGFDPVKLFGAWPVSLNGSVTVGAGAIRTVFLLAISRRSIGHGDSSTWVLDGTGTRVTASVTLTAGVGYDLDLPLPYTSATAAASISANLDVAYDVVELRTATSQPAASTQQLEQLWRAHLPPEDPTALKAEITSFLGRRPESLGRQVLRSAIGGTAPLGAHLQQLQEPSRRPESPERRQALLQRGEALERWRSVRAQREAERRVNPPSPSSRAALEVRTWEGGAGLGAVIDLGASATETFGLGIGAGVGVRLEQKSTRSRLELPVDGGTRIQRARLHYRSLVATGELGASARAGPTFGAGVSREWRPRSGTVLNEISYVALIVSSHEAPGSIFLSFGHTIPAAALAEGHPLSGRCDAVPARAMRWLGGGATAPVLAAFGRLRDAFRARSPGPTVGALLVEATYVLPRPTAGGEVTTGQALAILASRSQRSASLPSAPTGAAILPARVSLLRHTGESESGGRSFSLGLADLGVPSPVDFGVRLRSIHEAGVDEFRHVASVSPRSPGGPVPEPILFLQ